MSQVASLGRFTFSFEFELYFMRNGINCLPSCHWVWLYICISIGIGCLPNLSSIFLSWRHNDRRRTCVALFVQAADSDVLTGLRSPLLEMIQLVLNLIALAKQEMTLFQTCFCSNKTLAVTICHFPLNPVKRWEVEAVLVQTFTHQQLLSSCQLS